MAVYWSDEALRQYEVIEDFKDENDRRYGNNSLSDYWDAVDDAVVKIDDPNVTRKEEPPGSGTYKYVDPDNDLTIFYEEIPPDDKEIVAIYSGGQQIAH